MKSLHDMKDLLGRHALFEGLPGDILQVLAGCATNAHFAEGDVLFRTGGAADRFYLVRDGDVALDLLIPGRGRLTVQTLHGGDVVGASWIIPPHVWQFDARALTSLRATSLDAACLRGKCDADPALGYAVYKRFLPIIANRLQATRLQLVDLYAPASAVGAKL